MSMVKAQVNSNIHLVREYVFYYSRCCWDFVFTLCILVQPFMFWVVYIRLISSDRAEKLRQMVAPIECNVKLLGATRIEDKLQEGVPEATESIWQAGIKVWVLTGDKQETAISIGLSCKLLSGDMSR